MGQQQDSLARGVAKQSLECKLASVKSGQICNSEKHGTWKIDDELRNCSSFELQIVEGRAKASYYLVPEGNLQHYEDA